MWPARHVQYLDPRHRPCLRALSPTVQVLVHLSFGSVMGEPYSLATSCPHWSRRGPALSTRRSHCTPRRSYLARDVSSSGPDFSDKDAPGARVSRPSFEHVLTGNVPQLRNIDSEANMWATREPMGRSGVRLIHSLLDSFQITELPDTEMRFAPSPPLRALWHGRVPTYHFLTFALPSWSRPQSSKKAVRIAAPIYTNPRFPAYIAFHSQKR